jgi:hypothetical protein
MGGESRATHRKLYVNVMELLVAEEVDRQLANLPERVSKYIKRTEVETFALNRLPALYASSEKGLQHQYDRALHDFKSQIFNAVRQAFAAVQVDPIRLSQPLKLNQEEEAVLQALRELLKDPNLTWKSALKEIQRLQSRRRSGKTPPPPPPSSATQEPDSASESSREHYSEEHHSHAWRPGTYGSHVGWRPRHHQYGPGTGFEENAR